MTQKQFKIGLSNVDKQNMAQDVYERLLALTFPEYDASTQYSVGDFVVFNDQLYKCISATSGAWDSSKWQLATLNDLVADIENAVAFVNDKANVDGNYPTLTAGNADQLNSTVFVVDKVPYLYRTSGGDADIGNREYDKIIGGSLAVNQLVSEIYVSPSPTTLNGITLTKIDNETLTISGTATARISSNICLPYRIPVITNHCYLIFGMEKNTQNIGLIFNAFKDNSYVTTYAGKDTGNGIIVLNNNAETIELTIENGTALSKTYTVKPQVIDLTAMFGSTIADYIYALEQANAGAGVAWFRNYFKELYYPFNNGAIKNVKLVSHDMVGFNQWDEEWELGTYDVNNGIASAQGLYQDRIRSKKDNPIKAISGATYFAPQSVSWVLCYDKDLNYLGKASYSQTTGGYLWTTLVGTAYIRFNVLPTYGTTYNNDICINLSWSGWRNGQYEPYQKNSYPLDTTIELRGIPKLDSNNHLYFDGDEYSSDGKVVRKYGIVDLGSLDWYGSSVAGGGVKRFRSLNILSNAKPVALANQKANIVCSKYDNESSERTYASHNGISIDINGYIMLYDQAHENDTVEQFKTAVSGVYLVYELATPTEETATPFQEPQIVDDFGTEEYVVPAQDGWQIPVGHDTKYPANLRDKLQRLPDMPSVSQNVTETYVVNYNGTTKKCTFIDIAGWLGANGWIKLTDITGYDAEKTQSLKNVNGTLTWVDDE